LRYLTAGFGPRVRHFARRLTFRIKHLVIGPILKCAAIDVVDKRFSGRVFSRNQTVIIEFDVIIGEYLWHIDLLED
jgi:hypothetical protein